ncbi:hypothetical protein ACS0TY_021399 [Phlomoides rotata]
MNAPFVETSNNKKRLQRCGKSCRLRWTNYLRPDIKRGRFSFEEEETIIQLHSVLGNKWSSIAARLPGRTDNEIKNYWNTHIRKRLLRMGIDPVTHAPRLDHLDLSSLLNSTQLNLPNLIRLQTLLNPGALRIAMSLLSSNNDQNQFLNSHLQSQGAPTIQPNQFENIINQQIPSTTPTSFHNLSQTFQGDMNGQIFQNNLTPTSTNITTSDQSLPNIPNFCHISDQMRSDSSSSNNNSQNNFGFDSVFSTPLSSPGHLNSASVLTNEDERDSFCSDLLRFEIPEGLNFDDFM